MAVVNRIIKEDLAFITNAAIDWQRFNGKTVLITGANGFLPAYMVETLLYLNDKFPNLRVTVIALVRNKVKAQERFLDYINNDSLIFLEQDVTTPINYKGDLDFIIHAASQASPKYFGVDPVGTLSANVLGTINLMNLAREKNITSFLYFSSGEVYGEVVTSKMPVKEDNYGYLDPTVVRSCYGESKRMGENICVSYFHQYGIAAKIVRPFHTYGPKMQLNDGRVYADFVANILNKENIFMKSNGAAKRAFCYLADATKGFFTVLLNGANGEAYNIANPQQELNILELANKLVLLDDKLGLKVIEVSETANNDYLKSTISRNSANIDKAKKLGWYPEISIEEGFKRTIESYNNNAI